MLEIKRGGVYYARIRDGDGHIQRGTRPVVVIQNDIGNFYSPSTIVIPLTAAKKKNIPTHVEVNEPFLKYISTALCEQVTTIDKRDIKLYLGEVNQNTMKKIDDASRISIGL